MQSWEGVRGIRSRDLTVPIFPRAEEVPPASGSARTTHGASKASRIPDCGKLCCRPRKMDALPLPASIGAQGPSGTVTTARQISTGHITLGGNASSYGLVTNSDNAAHTLNLGNNAYTINGNLGNTTLNTGQIGTTVLLGNSTGAANLDAANDTNPNLVTRAQINGAISLVKSGAGNFTLGGTLANGATGGGNLYTGSTRILGGILVLGESLAIQNSAFDTDGSIAGDTTNGLRGSVTFLRLSPRDHTSSPTPKVCRLLIPPTSDN